MGRETEGAHRSPARDAGGSGGEQQDVETEPRQEEERGPVEEAAERDQREEPGQVGAPSPAAPADVEEEHLDVQPGDRNLGPGDDAVEHAHRQERAERSREEAGTFPPELSREPPEREDREEGEGERGQLQRPLVGAEGAEDAPRHQGVEGGVVQVPAALQGPVGHLDAPAVGHPPGLEEAVLVVVAGIGPRREGAQGRVEVPPAPRPRDRVDPKDERREEDRPQQPQDDPAPTVPRSTGVRGEATGAFRLFFDQRPSSLVPDGSRRPTGTGGPSGDIVRQPTSRSDAPGRAGARQRSKGAKPTARSGRGLPRLLPLSYRTGADGRSDAGGERRSRPPRPPRLNGPRRAPTGPGGRRSPAPRTPRSGVRAQTFSK